MGEDRRGVAALSRRGSWLVVAFSLASLIGLEPARRAEQWLAALLLPLDGLVARALPEPELLADRAALEQDAQAAWAAWEAALGARSRPLGGALRPTTLSVLRYDASRGELALRAGDAPLSVGSPVTHRGVLLGFIVARSADGRVAVRDGEARVALVGGPAARPVAATWQADATADPAHFLLAGSRDGPRITHKSREFDGRLRPLVTTRDVRVLGDSLPAGLLLGHLEPKPIELPGGGVGRGTGEHFAPLLDPARVTWVSVEVPAAWTPVAHPLSARVVASSRTASALLVDRGSLDGVLPGDLVVQGGLLLGRVVRCGPLTSEVQRGAGPGTVLVVVDDARVVPLEPDDAHWPDDGPASAGRPVFGGESGWGGLAVGLLCDPTPSSFTVAPLDGDPRRPVSVLRR